MVMEKLCAVIEKVVGIIKTPSSDFMSSDFRGLLKKLEYARDCLKDVDCEMSRLTIGDDGLNIAAPSGGVVQQFVQICLLLLEKVAEQCEESECGEHCVIASSDMSSVSSLVQFTVRFGVRLYLEPAVGLGKKYLSLADTFSLREKTLALCRNCNAIVRCCNNEMFRNILILTSLSDVIAALMQLCFSPASARLLDISQRKHCLKQLNEVLETWVSKDRIVREILILQGNASTHPAPKWLQDKCGQFMTRTLLEQNGVSLVISSMVSNFFSSMQPTEGGEWTRADAVASILSTLPAESTSTDEYCLLVCQQLVSLLTDCGRDQTEVTKETARISVAGLHAFQEQYPTHIGDVLSDLLLAPLERCCISGDNGFKNNVKSDELCMCVENLHRVCLHISAAQGCLLSRLVEPYLKVFLTLMCNTRESSSHLPSLVKDLVKACFKEKEKNSASKLLLEMYGEDTVTELKTPHNDLKFIISADGEIVPQVDNARDPSEILELQDIKVEVLLDILLHCEVDGIVGEVFITLMKSLCDPQRNTPNQVEQESKLLTDEDRAACGLKSNEARFMTFAILTALCEAADTSTLLSDVSQIISFIKTILVNWIDRPENKESAESLNTCVSILGLCLMSDMTSSEKKELSDLVPALQRLSELEQFNGNMKELLCDLAIAISTFGAISNPSLSMFSKTLQDQAKIFDQSGGLNKDGVGTKDHDSVSSGHQSTSKSTNITANQLSFKKNDAAIKSRTKPLIVEEVREVRAAQQTDYCDESTRQGPAGEAAATQDLSFVEAMDALFDPSPALKGGAIRYLTKCVHQKHPHAMEEQPKLAKVFNERLNDDDSFVYLSAVQGLAVISATSNDKAIASELLGQLVADFLGSSSASTKDLKSGTRPIDVRMKVGEVIMRIIKQMGDMAAHHASILLPEFLRGTRHSNPDMRASCLSNFSELAKMVPHRLVPIQYEVRDCLCGAARSDSDNMVRRAAVHGMLQIITALGDQFLQVFSGVAKDIYRTLKQCYDKDDDTGVQLHAQLALEELGVLMQNTLFKPTRLEKKITILPT